MATSLVFLDFNGIVLFNQDSNNLESTVASLKDLG